MGKDKMKRIGIEELHSVLLGIGKEFDAICRKHNIPYYMLGGTQLGACRHGGFIPWDDDMDFGIPRDFFDIFLSIAKDELPNKLSLLTINNSDRIISGVAKIEDNTTIIDERMSRDNRSKIGVFIDVFPLDRTNNEFGVFSKNKLLTLVYKFGGYRFLSFEHMPTYKRILAAVVKVLLLPLTPKKLYSFVERHLITNKGDYLANHFGAWHTKETMPFSYYGKPTEYIFEDTKFYGVEMPEEYLTHIYGDWRQLPPEDKRHIHLLNMYYK